MKKFILKHKAFLFDKIADGSFVFVGILCAFLFNQCQKDVSSKKELKSSINFLVRDLPTEEPTKKIVLKKIKMTKRADGKCNYSLGINNPFLSGNGENYLEYISSRGLNKYLDDQEVALLFISRELYSNYIKQANDKMRAVVDYVLKELPSEISTCLTESELNTKNKEFSELYKQATHFKYLAQSMGYQVRKQLIEKGYSPMKLVHLDMKVTDSELEFVEEDKQNKK